MITSLTHSSKSVKLGALLPSWNLQKNFIHLEEVEVSAQVYIKTSHWIEQDIAGRYGVKAARRLKYKHSALHFA